MSANDHQSTTSPNSRGTRTAGGATEIRDEKRPCRSPAVKSTLVTVATYNEIENLPRLVDAVFRYAPHVDILVVDDASPDGTGKWCHEHAAREPRLHCLHRPRKLGLGTATVAAMYHAVEHGYEFMLNLDADFSHDPAYIPALLEAMEGPEDPADVAIGSRYMKGGGVEGWPWYRRAMSRAVNAYARGALRLPIQDCSGAFRCYRVSLLKRLPWERILSKGYSFQEEILWHLKGLGARFREVPIVFRDRRRGKSKINPAEARRALWILSLLAWRERFGN